ncbi:MAG: ABC transporter ATP-binding protein [Sandaracinaceae bacterium]|nr:ABC transporter ATP-binding protein [Sandaracinaceae bacterium]
MIAARGLTKRYGPHRALDNASFEVKKGEIVGFLGPNGAGKSTTMKILTCYIAPSEGTAAIKGADIWDDPIGARAAIGYLPESTPLYGEMLVAEYLEFMGEMRGLQKDGLRKGIRRVVEECNLASFYAQEIRTLSKGQKQRVGLAQALIHEPPILILDEPMSGLDPNQAVEIRDLIRQLGKERTVILSTHNLAEVQVTCQRVLIISQGKLVADDTPQALTSRGRNRYTVVVAKGDKAREGAVREAFGKIKGVDSVRILESDSGETKLEVLPSSKDDLRADLFKAAVDGGFTLLELRQHAQNLEQIFRDLTLTASDDDEDDDDEEEEEAKPAAKAPAKAAAKDDEDEDEDEGSSKSTDKEKE